MSQALKKVDGVQKAHTDFASQRSIVHAKGNTCSPEGEEKLIDAVKTIGYDAEVLENKPKK